MVLMQGKGASKGIAQGPLYFFEHRKAALETRNAQNTEAEKKRLQLAQKKAIEQLEELAVGCREEAGDEAALLFETHAMLVEDEDYVTCILAQIEKASCTAEYAVQTAGEKFAAAFAAMENSYMQARAADIRDVSERLIDILTGEAAGDIDSDVPVILAADDLTPSETVRLDKNRILGIVLRGGSADSHTAILARSMGIPAVCGLGEKLLKKYSGQTAFVDGENGKLILDPDESVIAQILEREQKQREESCRLEAMRGREDITADGQRLEVYCNIGSPEEVEAVLANDGRGIGLFRSEFMYLAADHLPTEEEQFQAYKSVVSAMNGRRVIIRTLDVGADKQVHYFGMKREENPALGMRAIRICLNRPDIFRTHLRAICRASAYGKVAVMFPMITSLWEVRECRRICREAMAELDREGIPYNRDMEVGIMIETPAAVLIAGELAKEVDFFSVGTNDLTQYILACDRQSGDLDRFFDPHHPAVLRALRMAADAAHTAGIWIGICGELGSDLELLPAFLAMGIDEVSVPPREVLPMRMEIRGSTVPKIVFREGVNCHE